MYLPQWLAQDLDYTNKAVQEQESQRVTLRLTSVLTGGTTIGFAQRSYFDPDSIKQDSHITGISLNLGINNGGTGLQPFAYVGIVKLFLLTMYDENKRVRLKDLPLTDLVTWGAAPSNNGRQKLFDFYPNMKMSFVTCMDTTTSFLPNAAIVFNFHTRKRN